ncbi:MAG: restriction endonuclease subunit S [Methylocystis sp.]
MNWPIVELGDIFSIARGGSPRPIDNFITEDPDGVNWVMISDASNSAKFITVTKKKIKPSGVSRSRMVAPGDFLLTNSMSFGRPYIMQTSGCIHDGWLVLSPKKRNVNHDYFYHLLGSDLVYAEFEKRAAGATVKNLNIDLVSGIKVPLPPLDEQKRIAAILDQADNLRRLRQRAIDRLNELRQAIFYEMFGITELAQSDWPVKSLQAVVREDTLITYGIVQAGPEFERGVPYIRTGDIVDGRIETAGLKHTDPEIARRFARSRVEAGEIVMSIRATVGTAALVPPELEGANLTQGTARISPGPEVDRHYLIAFLRSAPAQNWIAQQVKGATFREITLARLRELPVPIPPIDLQRLFARTSLAAEEQASRAEKHALISQSLFSSLQHRAFTNQL